VDQRRLLLAFGLSVLILFVYQELIVRRDTAGWHMQHAGRVYAIRPYSYDLYVDRDLGAYLWDVLLAQGAPLGLKPVGRDQAIS